MPRPPARQTPYAVPRSSIPTRGLLPVVFKLKVLAEHLFQDIQQFARQPGIQPVKNPFIPPAENHPAGIAQGIQMFGYLALGFIQHLAQIVYIQAVMMNQQVDDPLPGGISQRLEKFSKIRYHETLPRIILGKL